MPTETDQPKERNMRVRPLYDIPYMFEAREFLRKKLIGKKVSAVLILTARQDGLVGSAYI